MTSPARLWKDKEHHNFTPRTKLALKLYATGAARTLREAGQIAGVHPGYVGLAHQTATGKQIVDALGDQISEKAVSLSAVIAALSEKALRVMEDQIESGSTEQVKFLAAKDILDRNPETSKTNKVQVESFTLSGRDAKEIAAALAEGKQASVSFAGLAQGDFVKVEEVPVPQLLTGGSK